MTFFNQAPKNGGIQTLKIPLHDRVFAELTHTHPFLWLSKNYP